MTDGNWLTFDDAMRNIQPEATMTTAGDPALYLLLATRTGWQRDPVARLDRRQWRRMAKVDRRLFARLRRRFNRRLTRG